MNLMKSSGMFTLTAIGSCRIVSPVKRAQPYFNFQANFKKIYGFTHTSSEALQQIRFFLGLIDIPAQVRPFIFRPAVSYLNTDIHSPSDFYIVEISSQKKIMAYGFCLQINYLTRHFYEFFSQTERARAYWSLASQGNQHKLLAYLKDDPCFAEMSESDRALLSSINVEQMDEHAIEQDMQEIVQLLGRDRVMFMTHIDAVTRAGTVIQSRSRLIKNVDTIAARMGIPCVNPTNLMEKWGQKRALEKNGDDLTHYTDMFGDAIVATIFKNVINSTNHHLDEGRQEKQDQIRELTLSITKQLADGDIIAASQQLFAALRHQQKEPVLIQLRSVIFSRLGYYEQAYQDISDVEKIIGTTDSTLRCRLRSLHGLARWQEALSTAEMMLSNEIEDEEVLTVAASSADALQLFDKSYQYWKRVLLLNPVTQSGWVSFLSSTQYFNGGNAFSDAFQAGIQSQCLNDAFMETALSLAVKFRDELIFMQALEQLLRHESEFALTVLSTIHDTGLVIRTAFCIKNMNYQQALSTSYKDKLHDVFEAWNNTALSLHSVEDFVSLSTSLVYSYSAFMVYPHARISRFNNEVKAAWRDKLREMYEREDYENILAGAKIVWPLLEFDPVSTVYCARTLVNLGAWKEACTLAHMTLIRNSNITSLQSIMLRSIRHINDIPFLIDLIANVMSISPSFQNASMNDLFEKECRNVATRALKYVRQKKSEGRLDEALSLLISMKRIDPDVSRLMREYKQIIRLFNDSLRDGGSAIASYEHLDYAKKLLVFDSENAYALKYAALNAMHLRDYSQALQYWQRLEKVNGPTDSVTRQVTTCIAALQKNTSGKS
ncbi:Vi polysaccharide biosynthesis protein TviD [Citrobacter sp. Ce006]|uniref:Vi polysaccharide biosynthesis protein TviD n=1 Tax=Citrobacter sp. Ce006 TaxID=2985039 RepID=UPI002577C3CF|nr:Vi polysaccharide biosynthesis protein TviD [Citrobacter sp. Ce006]MDM3317421.1 Vi polysaccharide biosynthesis protein TviD [Citrobacter sp. Ce006]